MLIFRVPPFVGHKSKGVFYLPAKYAKRREKKNCPMPEILFKDESYKIIGACFEVYKQKGCGFTEPMYQECLRIESRIQCVPFVVSTTATA